MSKDLVVNLMSLSLGIVGMVLVGYHANLMVLLGIFLMLWSNNITISQHVGKINKKEISYLKQLVDTLFGENLADLEEKMSRNMKVSDK